MPGTTVDLAPERAAAAALRRVPTKAAGQGRVDVRRVALAQQAARRSGAKSASHELHSAPTPGERAVQRSASDDKRQAGRGRDREGLPRAGAPTTPDAALDQHELPSMTGRVIDGDQLMLYRTVVRDSGRDTGREC